MASYKEEMKLTDEEIIKLHPAVMMLEVGGDETPCVACAQKTAKEQLKKCLRVLSSMELLELEGKAEDRAEQERLMLEAEAEAQAKADDAAMWAERETDDMPKIFIPELDDEGDQ